MRARLVGRERELRLMLDTFSRAREDRRAQLFTIVGNAGVGKSRLVGEFLARVGASGASGDVRVLRGRCLPYGTGVTFWPLLELLQSDAGITLADDRDQAVAKLDERLAALIRDERERRAVGVRMSVALGLAEAA